MMHAAIKEQLEEGVVQRTPAEVTVREFYLLHRAVVRGALFKHKTSLISLFTPFPLLG